VGFYAAFTGGVIVRADRWAAGMISGATGALASCHVVWFSQHGVDTFLRLWCLIGSAGRFYCRRDAVGKVLSGWCRIGDAGLCERLAIVIFVAPVGPIQVRAAGEHKPWHVGPGRMAVRWAA